MFQFKNRTLLLSIQIKFSLHVMRTIADSDVISVMMRFAVVLTCVVMLPYCQLQFKNDWLLLYIITTCNSTSEGSYTTMGIILEELIWRISYIQVFGDMYIRRGFGNGPPPCVCVYTKTVHHIHYD